METDFQGPLPSDTMGLLLGRSSSALRGLVVIPGVINPDYTGTVKIMVESPRGIIAISPGDKIAQLLLLPSKHKLFPANAKIRGDRGFGSTGTHLTYLSMNMDTRPVIEIIIEGKHILGLLDTGADKSIISIKDWPATWPTKASEQTLRGLGFENAPKISTKELTWKDGEGRSGKIQPYVLDLPISLWGRDLLRDMGVRLTNEYSPAAQDIMRRMGHIPGRGIGKNLQGRVDPVHPASNNGRQGLGFS